MPVFGWPTWLVAGVALGVAFSLFASAAFLLGTRLFPDAREDQTRGATADERRREDHARGPTADERRREEIRGYLRYTGERFSEDHPVAGEQVAFYLPEHDVAVTFDPRAYFRIDGTDTDAVLVEHELPGAALGQRLPFETPDRASAGQGTTGAAGASGRGAAGVTDGDPPGAHGVPSDEASAFATLGLPATADVEAVRAAYREQVVAVHPDQDGDPEAFQRLREAYAVAREAAQRSR